MHNPYGSTALPLSEYSQSGITVTADPLILCWRKLCASWFRQLAKIIKIPTSGESFSAVSKKYLRQTRLFFQHLSNTARSSHQISEFCKYNALICKHDILVFISNLQSIWPEMLIDSSNLCQKCRRCFGREDIHRLRWTENEDEKRKKISSLPRYVWNAWRLKMQRRSSCAGSSAVRSMPPAWGIVADFPQNFTGIRTFILHSVHCRNSFIFSVRFSPKKNLHSESAEFLENSTNISWKSFCLICSSINSI